MLCPKHQFIKTTDVGKMPPGPASVVTRSIPGVEAVCILCGQVRRAYADGTLVIVEAGEGYIRPDDELDNVSARRT